MRAYHIAAISPTLQVANVQFNLREISEKMRQADERLAKVVVFPRLCLCGCTCGDLFFQPLLIEKCMEALAGAVAVSRGKHPVYFLGMPMRIGDDLCDVAVAVRDGKVLGIIPDSCPSGENSRYFSAPKQTEVIVFQESIPCSPDLQFDVDGKQVACVVGQWKEGLRFKGLDLLANCASSTEGVGKPDRRRKQAKMLSDALGCVVLVCNPAWGESTSTDVYSAHNVCAKGNILCGESLPFGKGELFVDISLNFPMETEQEKNDIKLSSTPFLPEKEDDETYRLIFEIQAHALAKRLMHTRAKTAVIGVSGGLDSTLALLVTARAFDILKKDRKELIAVTMPGFGTTGKTFQNALTLIDELNATSKTVDIKASVLQHFRDIGHDPARLDTTYENAQARMRTLILMDVANATGGLVVGTGDLSELALGWCTYNGDHMSMYSVNASVPKTLVRYLVGYLAKKQAQTLQAVLLSVLDTEISPELLPPSKDGKIAQKTEELVGPYDLLDFYLYHVIGENASPKQTFDLAKQAFHETYNDETLKKWLKNFYRRFFAQQFKRSCSPDGANIGIISFSPVKWRMPADACADVWLDEMEKL